MCLYFLHDYNLHAYNFIFWYEFVREPFLGSFSYFSIELPGVAENFFRVRPVCLLTLGLPFSSYFSLKNENIS